VIQTEFLTCRSRAENGPAGPSRHARGCAGAGTKGFSDRKCPHRFAYAHAVNAKGGFGRWCCDVVYEMAKMQDVVMLHGVQDAAARK